ncbi:hypothetical protein [Actinokineospora cianjurensis]|uniref:Uncharacterized protein n=1 Tax=Actinokineospora cianjurensis TaxID=585224 RepID=A0A421B8M3_9PSEU|nr:hypothetical protein [Actinokineospora cianjurensis]RLK60714.1 hypothetical protein CLV68_1223 [Actinokineospora cianjurensis]
MRRPVLWCVLSFLLGVALTWRYLTRTPPPRPPWVIPTPKVRIPLQSPTTPDDEFTHVSGTLDDAFTAPAAPAGPDGMAPSTDYTVKGTHGVFHTTESPAYPTTTATVWFRTVADAERAGFVPWTTTSDR